MDFVWPFLASEAKDDEIRFSVRSVEKHFQGEVRTTIIGDKPPWYSGQYIPIPRVKSGDHQAFRDTFNRLSFAARSKLIGDSFVWMMDDIYFMDSVTREQIETQWHAGS